MENKYQITKTIRFGLTVKKIVNGQKRKNPSHTILEELVNISEEKIKANAKQDIKHSETTMLNIAADCSLQMHEYLKKWEVVFMRTDQISLTKEFYRIMSRKGRFDGFWYEEKLIKKTGEKVLEKMPKAQSIKISTLTSVYEGKKRKEYIVNYWNDNIKTAKRISIEFTEILQKYQTAIKQNDKAHQKPYQVDFRKMLLSLCNVVNETLIPLINGSIVFADIEKLSDEHRNDVLKDFSSKEGREERQSLFEKINEVKAYFECNGGYVPFGRVTLNQHTESQKPQIFNDDIKNIISKLQIAELVKILENKSDDEIRNYFSQQSHFQKLQSLLYEKNKLGKGNNSKFEQFLIDSKKPIIQTVQLFKCKAVPASVRFALAEYLFKSHKIEKDNTLRIFSLIGEPVSPAYDYSKLSDAEKGLFSLERYPIKLSFDYAWENVAREMKKPGVRFPKEDCLNFLKEKFQVDTAHSGLKLYSELLYIKDCLSTLEHENNEPNDKEKFIKAIEEALNNIDNIQITLNYKKHIINWINKSEKEQKDLKAKNDSDFINFCNAKQKIGFVRGSQKNEIEIYNDFTQLYKDLASLYGKNFAELREKFREEYQLNKVKFAAIIIEDQNGDKYSLLQNLEKKKSVEDLYKDRKDGELTTFKVKSLTSKTLIKLIKNPKGYKKFHTSALFCDFKKVKQNWKEYQKDPKFIDYVKDCLTNSTLSREQNWQEFGWDFTHCNDYLQIEKEIDQKAHILESGRISIAEIQEMINSGDYLLLPIVNQDITSKTRQTKNQFSKDWEMIFDTDLKEYRLHPEFSIVYRQATPDYPKTGEKRYSHFQMIANMQCEIVPQRSYISKKEQIRTFNNKEEQVAEVKEFNRTLNINNEFYIIGIDRGIKQLATLCVLNHKGEVHDGFSIFTREFDTKKKQWIHQEKREESILDLSNLRVEKTVNGVSVLVDLSTIITKDEKGEYTKTNKQTIKLKQLSYIRKLQYKMQYDETSVISFFEKYTTNDEIKDNMSKLILPYKEGERYSDLPYDEMKSLYKRFKSCIDSNDNVAKTELIELDAAEGLKTGVVANMIGVIAYLIKDVFKYKVVVSLENLCNAFYPAIDGLSGDRIQSTRENPDITYMEQENKVLAGVGTYRYFEMQLLKKLFRMQQEANILNLVPAFRSVDNYEKIVRSDKNTDESELVVYPFGIVRFVDPSYTSHKCPNPSCNGQGKKDIIRKDNVITCKKCGYSSSNEYSHQPLKYIKNGDDNGAYHIAQKALRYQENKNN